MYESLFAEKMTEADEYYSWMHGDCDIQHYTMNSMLHLKTLKDKYIKMYNKFILHLYNYAKVIRILAKGNLPMSLITPLKLQEILTSVKEMLIKTNPDYDIIIKRLHLYYDIKLVTFGIGIQRNLLILFPIFIQPYTQQPLILYWLEMVPVPVVDKKH